MTMPYTKRPRWMRKNFSDRGEAGVRGIGILPAGVLATGRGIYSEGIDTNSNSRSNTSSNLKDDT
jgi:hypothetical protein